MFDQILVPLDGSERAEQALVIAGRIARACKGTLLLVCVLETSAKEKSLVARKVQEQREETGKSGEAKDYTSRVISNPALAGVRVQIEVVEGDVAEQILEVAHKRACNLIVMCSHGYSSVKRWVLGSVAYQLVRRSNIPVLVVRDGGYVPLSPYPDPSRPLRSIKGLVALDGSQEAEAMLESAGQLVAALAGTGCGLLQLVCVVQESMQSGEYRTICQDPLVEARPMNAVEAYMLSIAKDVDRKMGADLHLVASGCVVVARDPGDALVKVAEEGLESWRGGCDFIAMTTHGRAGIDHLTIGSVMERVLMRTKLPLLVKQTSSMQR